MAGVLVILFVGVFIKYGVPEFKENKNGYNRTRK